jgi:hypothetical protein
MVTGEDGVSHRTGGNANKMKKKEPIKAESTEAQDNECESNYD